MPKLLDSIKSFEEAIRDSRLSVIHFYADWADQCTQINDILSALSSQPEYVDAKFYKCAAEDLSEVSLKHKIEAVPTVLLFRKNKEVDRINGADPAKVTAKIKLNLRNDDITDEPVEKSLDERLKDLVNRSKVMLFMKGDRDAPRCGFSKQIVQILNDTGVSYETFDILTDEEVRQGLKEYSDWPTYPQLYVKGELLGGLDITKEMVASNELVSTLNQ